MSKLMYIQIIIAAFIFTSCIPEDDNGEPDPDEVVTFADAGLEQCVRDELDKETEDIQYKDLGRILFFNCSGYEIESLEGIENIKNLREAQLGNNKIKDVTPLGKCTKLVELELDNNQIEDASPLSSLVNLTRLNMQGNEVNNLSFIPDLIALESLYVNNNPIASIPRFEKQIGLKELSLGQCGLSNIKNVEQFTELKGSCKKVVGKLS